MNKMFTISYFAKANITEIDEQPVEILDTVAQKKIAPKSNIEQTEKQRDLMKMDSILFSTGINKNDDVFLKEEILPARNTGAHKPVNIEHEPQNILGHMLRTYITTKDGKKINDDKIDKDSDVVPNKFDVMSEAVLYSFVFPEETKKIKEKSKNGELFVSVEVWFADYDYLVGNKIIKRNEQTEGVLDPILKANGGNGILDGQRVGRVLREMLIGGMGIVKNPANPESIIKSISGLEELEELDVLSIDDIIVKNIIGDVNCEISKSKQIVQEVVMPDEAKKVEEIKKDEIVKSAEKPVEAKIEIKDTSEQDQKMFNEVKTMCESVKTKLDEVVASKTETKEEVKQDSNKELLAELKALRESNEQLSNRIKAFELKDTRNQRKEIMQKELGLADEFVEQKLDKVAKMSDDEFKDYLAEAKSYIALKTEETKETEEVEAETSDSAEIEANKKDTTEKILDTIKDLDPALKVETDKTTDSLESIQDVLVYNLERRNAKWGKLREKSN